MQIFTAFGCCNVDPTEEPKREPEALFYGSRKPWHKIKKERPLHLAAAHLAAEGANNRRIAHSLGKTEVWMSNLAWQPFFQERVDSILRERNRDALESMSKIQRFANPATLVELCDASFFLKARSRISLARTIRVFTTGFLGSEVTSLDRAPGGHP